MTFTDWFLLGFFVLSVLIYIISNVKKIKYLDGICGLFFIPTSCFFIIRLLNNYLPDSRHIIFISTIAIIFISLRELLIWFKIPRLQKIFTIIEEFLYIANIFTWIQLYKTTFYIYRTNGLCTLIVIVLFVFLFGFMCLMIGKNNFKYSLKALISFFLIGYLNYCAIISYINCHDIYAIILIIGTLLLLCDVIFFSIQTIKPFEINIKLEKIIRVILITSSQFLITTSGLLMIN